MNAVGAEKRAIRVGAPAVGGKTGLTARAARLSRAVLPTGARCLVACSGGADSVFLLHSMVERKDLDLVVWHADHGLRGTASLADAGFVRALARSLGLPFRLVRLDLHSGPGLEERARIARYAALSRTLVSEDRSWALLGHHAADQRETVMMRLLRGTGPGGVRGMAPRRFLSGGCVVRPLLGIEPSAMKKALEKGSHEWREDRTNTDHRFTRNRIRTLFPLLSDGGCVERRLDDLAHAASDWSGAAARTANLALRGWAAGPSGSVLRRSAMDRLGRMARPVVWRAAFEKAGAPYPPAPHLRRLLRWQDKGCRGAVAGPGMATVTADRTAITIRPPLSATRRPG